MGKHGSNSPDPIPGNVPDDTWTKILTAAVTGPNGAAWVSNAAANAANAGSN